MIRLVLFDIDGTLIASGGAGVRAFGEVARATFGVPGGTSRMTFAGRTDVSLVREFFRNEGIADTRENLTRFLEDYLHWLATYLEECRGRIMPGVIRALDELRNMPNAPVLGLLTGNIRLGAELKLRRYGLWEHFELGAFADDAEERNGIAAMAHRRGNERLGRELNGEEVLVIGDTRHDITCARAIGARCLAVATGGTDLATLRAEGPAWAVNHLDEVSLSELCAGRKGAAN